MSDVISAVLELSAHPDKLNDGALEVLSDIVARHPYFDAARILYLAALKCSGSSRYESEYRSAMLFLPDTDTIDVALDRILSKRESALLQSDKTMCALNDFLGEASENEVLIPESPVTSDYLSTLELDPQSSVTGDMESDTDKLIAAFLSDDQHVRTPENMADAEPENNAEPDSSQFVGEDLFTETLADIYIRQHRYEEAIEIIRYLYLNFPNKSCYFADQIRFLETLIKVNKQKNK